ncbi:hypothetical protein MA16_Dca011734 [Dendrobium catenatum]|uniref:Uncharacterized protein n=1 Tax=Dendrobium catenatum TaxID=906689 RepID=A0A2I0WEC9_9ASPA|nr:hypothetical protein MA16_Dca011734 [Dendrobium catenatum]
MRKSRTGLGWKSALGVRFWQAGVDWQGWQASESGKAKPNSDEGSREETCANSTPPAKQRSRTTTREQKKRSYKLFASCKATKPNSSNEKKKKQSEP